MDCSTDALMRSANCFRCIPAGSTPSVLTYLMCQWANKPTGCTSAVVDSWVARVQANGGGAPAQSTIDALCIFMTGLDAAGITGQMHVVNVFAPTPPSGDTILLATARTPLIVNVGTDPWTNANFVAGDYTINGLKGNGVSKCLLTGMVPNTFLAAARNGMSLYAYECPTGPQFEAMSHANDAAGTFGMYNSDPGGGNMIWDDLSFNTPPRLTFPSQGAGFYCGVRRDVGNDDFVYYGKSSTARPIAAIAGPGGAVGLAPSPAPLNVFCRTAVGDVRVFFSNARLSFYAVHKGLTASNVDTLFGLVQALRVSFGGGFV